jgi:hypothetical protein
MTMPVCDREQVRRKVFVALGGRSSLVSIGKSGLERIVWTLIDFSISGGVVFGVGPLRFVKWSSQ